MTDLTLGITLKADGTGFVGEVKVSGDELTKFGKKGKDAGDQASKGFDGATAALGKLKSMVVSAIGAYAGFAGAQRFISAAVAEITKAEKATANLNAVLRATGGTVGFTAGQLSDLADQLERSTLFDDAEIKQAEAVLLTFRQVQGDTFREAIGLATDLAALMGGDLQGAVLQLGKALEDPETGLTALRRSGISFTEAQRDLIKSLVETGDRAQAMDIILSTVAGQIGGVAAEQVTGLTGALNELDDAWGDFLKSLADSKAFDVAISGLKAITGWIERLNAGGLDAIQNEMDELAARRDEIVGRIAEFQNSPTQQFFGGVTGAMDIWTKELGEIEARLVELQDMADQIMLNKPDQAPVTPKPIGGGSGAGETDAAKKIREVIEALQFESDQLSRTAEQQDVYNALHQAGADINSKAGQTIQQIVASIQQKTDAQTLTDAAQEAANATMEEGRKLMEELRTPTEVYADTIEHLGDLLAQGAIDQETFNRGVELAGKTLDDATDKTDSWKESWKSMGAVSTEALADILLHAKNVGDVLDGLGQQLLQILSQKLFAGPMNSLFDGIFDSLFPSAKGNAFNFGRVVPMAKGHVTSGPELFPMANGGVGLRGEAGTEGVMPLQRDSQGRLGVIAVGGRGGGGVEINIHTPPGSKTETQQRQAGDGRSIVDLVVSLVNDQIANRKSIGQTIEATYGVGRRTRS